MNNTEKPSIDVNLLRKIASWMRTIGYFMTMGLFGLIMSSLGPVLPELAAQVAVPMDMISVIFTARALGFLFGSQIGGRVFDKYKAHMFFTISLLIVSLLIAFIPLSESFWLLVGMVFGQGMAFGLVVVGASTFIVWEHAKNPGPWLNAQSFINGLGGFLSPLVISYSYTRFAQYSQSFWFFAFIICLLSAFFFFLPSPKIRKVEKTGEDLDVGSNGLIYLVALIFLLYVGAESSLNGWIFSIAKTAYNFSDVNARLLNSAFWGAIAIGRLIGILTSKYLPSDKQLFLSYSGAVICILSSVIFRQSDSILWIAYIGAGLFMALIFPSLMMFTEKRLKLTGKKTGLFFSATSVGGMLIPWVSGQIYTNINPFAVNILVLTSLIFGFIVFILVRYRMNILNK